MSTTFARQAIVDHKLDTKIISIDPSPRAEIDALCDFVVRSCCEDVDPAFFASMTSRDLLFVDNSHRSFQNSDVTVFFTEILPSLPAGCTYGLHDIFLPLDYPREWVDRFYNEQYLLAAYLLGGAGGDQIVLANGHVESQSHLCSLLDPLWLLDPICGRQRGGGAFWMRRGTVGNV